MLINKNPIIKEGFNLFEIDTDNDLDLSFDIDLNCNLFIKIIKAKKINVNCNVNKNATIVFWNDSSIKIETKENYNVLNNAEFTLAYVECNDYETIRDLNVYLDDDHTSALVSSASLLNCLKQYRINVVNKAKNTFADMKNYAVVLDKGKLVIDAIGKIEKGSKKSSSHQTSRALCFGDKQTTTILPELLIDENDVQASHAMSIGRVDDKHLYYMMSRGLSLKECTNLISLGYLLPITEYIADETLRNTLRNQLESKLSNV